MTRCLDIHTHHPAPQPLAVINANRQDFSPLENQLYSVGIHPWDTFTSPTEDDWQKFETLCRLPEVVAIGECGFDTIKGGHFFRQVLIFKRQMEISEKIGKPLIIHDVRAHDSVVGYRREYNPSQNWVVHGFRGKPTVAKMLTDAGIYLSFGEYFNADTLVEMPTEMILAETDESPRTIQQIIASLSASIGYDITERIAMNTSNFLRMGDINNLGAI